MTCAVRKWLLHVALVGQIQIAYIAMAQQLIRPNTSSGENALQSLTRLGSSLGVPLGIVLATDRLCKAQLDLRKLPADREDLINLIHAQLPDQSASISDGVLIIQPMRSVQSSVLLNLVIPRFVTARSTPEQVMVALWMNIRAELKPDEGTAFNGPLPRNGEVLNALDVRGATVGGLLDLIVGAGSKGTWIMHPISQEWFRNPIAIPFDFHMYSEKEPSSVGGDCAQRAGGY